MHVYLRKKKKKTTTTTNFSLRLVVIRHQDIRCLDLNSLGFLLVVVVWHQLTNFFSKKFNKILCSLMKALSVTTTFNPTFIIQYNAYNMMYIVSLEVNYILVEHLA